MGRPSKTSSNAKPKKYTEATDLEYGIGDVRESKPFLAFLDAVASFIRERQGTTFAELFRAFKSPEFDSDYWVTLAIEKLDGRLHKQ